MVAHWEKKRVLITVRTYPTPARKGIEVSCTGGVTDAGEWIRLFPVPYRFLEPDRRFKKYQWIDVDAIKAADDPRPESFKLNIETVRVGSKIPTTDRWRARKDVIFPLRRPSLCQIEKTRNEKGAPTLGIFKPAEIKQLRIEKTAPDWSSDQMAILSQQLLSFGPQPSQTLEKIPYDFRYEFRCDDTACRGHKIMCTDWEMGESYRRWAREYGDNWEAKFRLRYETEMISKNDTHFYVGTVHQHPGSWIIVGLFYPPKSDELDFFE